MPEPSWTLGMGITLMVFYLTRLAFTWAIMGAIVMQDERGLRRSLLLTPLLGLLLSALLIALFLRTRMARALLVALLYIAIIWGVATVILRPLGLLQRLFLQLACNAGVGSLLEHVEHEVDDDAGDRDVQPDGQRQACQAAVGRAAAA